MHLKISFFLLILASHYSAQIGGLSANKINAYSTDVVSINKIEFEPSILINFSRDVIKQNEFKNNHVSDDEILRVNSNLYFRFTYGVVKNFEIGFSVPENVDFINLGFKYKLPYVFDNIITLGILAGINIPLGNKYYYLTNVNFTEKLFTTGFAFGIAASSYLTKKSSIDFNVIWQSHLPKRSNGDFNKFDYSLNADYGYYIASGLQAILGVSYYKVTFNDVNLNQTSLIFIPGISIEKGKNYGFSLSFSFSAYSKNIRSLFGFNFVLTILIE